MRARIGMLTMRRLQATEAAVWAEPVVWSAAWEENYQVRGVGGEVGDSRRGRGRQLARVGRHTT